MKPDRPSGNIFIFTDRQQIYQYNISGDRFSLINEEPFKPFDFAVSSNGAFVTATFADSTLGMYHVPGRKWKYYNIGAPLKGPVSCNMYGNIIAFTVLNGTQRRIDLFYPQSGSVYGMDLGEGNWADFPLFEKSAGNLLAYTQDNGFFVNRIPNGVPTKLSDSLVTADDFSSTGQYVSASGKIYDLLVYQYYPSTASGEIRFVNQSKIVYNKTSRKNLTLAKYSGVQDKSIYQGQDSILFTIAPAGDLIAFHDKADQGLIRFYIFNPISEVTTTSLPEEAGRIKKMFWRDSPVGKNVYTD